MVTGVKIALEYQIQVCTLQQVWCTVGLPLGSGESGGQGGAQPKDTDPLGSR